MAKYIDLFIDNDSIIDAYRAPEDALKDATVYLAWYEYRDYSGYSWVVFEKDGILYEVNGSHCSCYGLEGQWEPEVTTWAAIAWRGSYASVDDEIGMEIQKLVKEHTDGGR